MDDTWQKFVYPILLHFKIKIYWKFEIMWCFKYSNYLEPQVNMFPDPPQFPPITTYTARRSWANRWRATHVRKIFPLSSCQSPPHLCINPINIGIKHTSILKKTHSSTAGKLPSISSSDDESPSCSEQQVFFWVDVEGPLVIDLFSTVGLNRWGGADLLFFGSSTSEVSKSDSGFNALFSHPLATFQSSVEIKKIKKCKTQR